MKKIFKIILILIISISLIFALFILEEGYRFNYNLGSKPLIIINKEESKNLSQEKYYSLGYTIKYKYHVIQKENSDNIELITISGEFKLFDKFMLWTWIS